MEEISEEEKNEIVKYGIERLKVILISTLVTIIMSFLLGVGCQGILFWLSLSILRKYAGGYHADTEKRCYIISFIVMLSSLLWIRQKNTLEEWEIILQSINFLIILFFVPVENINHILDEEEKKKYGIKSRIIIVLLYTIYILAYFMNKQEIANSIGTAISVLTISLILGYIKIIFYT